jgi:catechol 2,3-dioxygenase-like lactoylglutathione lyase family enzyme
MGQATIAPDPAVPPLWSTVANVPPVPSSRFDHIDLVVVSLPRALEFYRGLLDPLGWTEVSEITGERGESVLYLSSPERGAPALGLREQQSADPQAAYDRYAIGLHHICFTAPNREAVDERAEWLVENKAEIESPPQEYDYAPGYYAVFFYDPDGIKLELRADPSGPDQR